MNMNGNRFIGVIILIRLNKNFDYGKVLEIVKKSNSRREPECKTYKRCGGCSLRHIDYEETLNIKQNMVRNLVNKSLNKKIQVNKWAAGRYYYIQ